MSENCEFCTFLKVVLGLIGNIDNTETWKTELLVKNVLILLMDVIYIDTWTCNSVAQGVPKTV